MSNASILDQAIAAHQAADFATARQLYMQALAADAKNADAHALLGALELMANNLSAAQHALAAALQLDESHAVAWHNLGLVHAARGDKQAAIGCLLKALNLAPTHMPTWLPLAKLFIETKQLPAAENILTQFLATNPHSLEAKLLQARLLVTQGDYAVAEKILTALAEAAFGTNNQALLQEIFTDFNTLIGKQPFNDKLNAAYMQLLLDERRAAPWVQLARIFLTHMRTFLAEACLHEALAREPDAIEAHWLLAFAATLPMYATQDQVERMREIFEARMQKLNTLLAAIPPEKRRGLQYLPELYHPIFFAYSGTNVKEGQRLTGQAFCSILQACYPIPPFSPPAARTQNGKIKIALVSETMYFHSNMKLRRSWLRRLDRNKFHITCLHVGKIVDDYTQEIKGLCDELYHYPQDFDGCLGHLLKLQPDIIQYTNLGLNPLTVKLASLRLAPVQATTWGHPITSGLPTIDYFLSSDLMEPAGAEAHYTETMVRLPGLSVVPDKIFDRMQLPELPRSHFGLQADDVFYLCIQSATKYLPKYDDVYARIAKLVPKAKFVFIEPFENRALMDTFIFRLRAPFHKYGLNPDDYLIILPFQDQAGYRALNIHADITLDSLGWSGANTSFEGLELGGLILTYGDEFMRGRHTHAIYLQMELPELIADSIDSYVAKAAALGEDPYLRQELRAKVQAALPKLYADPGLGPALNNFYESAYNQWRANPQCRTLW